MFKVKCKDGNEAHNVARAVNTLFQQSRFEFARHGAFGSDGGVNIKVQGRNTYVTFAGIRLKEKKFYCGNHAGPCRLTFKTHRKLNYLEGLDWVSFNDLVNDALDSIGHDGNAGNDQVTIRKGRMRCIEYFEGDKGNGEWDKNGRYADCIGKVPPLTEYPSGTPGIIGWREGCTEMPFEEAA